MFEDLREQLKDRKLLKNKPQIVKQLAGVLAKVMRNDQRIGIAFSGGLDSCLMAMLSRNFALYTVGLHGSPDIEYARRAAELMKWPLKVKELTRDEAELIIRKVTQILKASTAPLNAMNIGVGCVTYSVLKMAKDDGHTEVRAGLGSEDLFAGYEWHTDYRTNYDPAFIQETLWKSFHELDERDLKRDSTIAKHLSMVIETPFLNRSLVEFGMQIHPSLKVTAEEKKIILRETALSIGLPREFAYQKRRAAQFGSRFDKVVQKMLKNNKTLLQW